MDEVMEDPKMAGMTEEEARDMETDDPLWGQLKKEDEEEEEEVVTTGEALQSPSYFPWTVKGVQPC